LEEWKYVTGSHRSYQVSNFGRMKSIITTNVHHLLTLNRGKLGNYIQFSRRNYCKGRMRMDKVVAQHFVVNPDPNLLQNIFHIDGDIFNDNANNLEWVEFDNQINKENIRDIYILANSNIPYKDIQLKFKVSKKDISHIKNKTLYSEVTEFVKMN